MFSKKTYLAKGEPKLNDQITSIVMPAFQKKPLNIWQHPFYGTFDPNKKAVNFGILTHQNSFDKRLIKTYDTKVPDPSSNLYTSHITINHQRTEIETTKYDALEKEFIKGSQRTENKVLAEKINGKLPIDYFDAPAKYHGCVINHNHFDDWLKKQPQIIVPDITNLHKNILDQKYDKKSLPTVEELIQEMHNTGLPMTIRLKEYDKKLGKITQELNKYIYDPNADSRLVSEYIEQIKEIEELRRLLRTQRYI